MTLSVSPGLIVEHSTWGLGKVMEVQVSYVVVHFASLTNTEQGPRRKLQRTAPQLSISGKQSTSALDGVPITTDKPARPTALHRSERRGRTARQPRSKVRTASGVWWLAVDLKNTNYAQLKERQVIAQGWPGLGDLTEFVPLAGIDRISFDAGIQQRFRARDEDGSKLKSVRTAKDPAAALAAAIDRATNMMWKFLSVRQGDLFVAIEGTTVKGMCKLDRSVLDSYKFDDEGGRYNYAQTYGHPVEWIDWDRQVMGSPPVAPNQSVQAIAGLQNDRKLVASSWLRHQESTLKGGLP